MGRIANNLTGLRFSRFVVLEPTDRRSSSGSVIWRCLCDCGEIREVRSDKLKTGLTQSCTCLQKERVASSNSINITNQRFGILTAIRPTSKRKQGNIVWICKCDCGNTKEIKSNSLLKGGVQHCGCLTCRKGTFLYLFRSRKTGLIKIGISINLVRRKRDLERELEDTLDILFYKSSSRLEETNIHYQFKQYRAIHPNHLSSREWFNLDNRQIELITKS